MAIETKQVVIPARIYLNDPEWQGRNANDELDGQWAICSNCKRAGLIGISLAFRKGYVGGSGDVMDLLCDDIEACWAALDESIGIAPSPLAY